MSARFLLYSSVNDHNKHRMWVTHTSTSRLVFDIVLAYYGDNDEYFDKGIVEFEDIHIKKYKRKGFKWPNFNDYIKHHDVSHYAYIWVVDDDIEMTGDQIGVMFETLVRYPHIMVGSPSTSFDSVDSLDGCRTDTHRCDRLIEYTNFVENGLMILNTMILQNTFFRQILDATNTGFWFDVLMKYSFLTQDSNTHPTDMAILHNVQARHPKRSADNLSDLDKIIPRDLHKDDVIFFTNIDGVTLSMLEHRIVLYDYVRADVCSCADCSNYKKDEY